MPLIESISPNAWTSERRFGPFTNCYTFMTGFDEQFIGTLGVTALRPEDLGWIHFSTKREWKDAVEMYFSPGGPLICTILGWLSGQASRCEERSCVRAHGG
jgi:hypothetical protein